MASVEHCLCCFEVLSAELDDRDPLSLADVQKSYAAYLASLQSKSTTQQSAGPKKIPALARLAANNPPAGSSSTTSLAGSGGSTTASSSTSLSSANTAATSVSSSSSSSSSIPPAAAATPRERVTDPEAQYPLFVTWDKLSSSSSSSPDEEGEYHLRGCIGTFSSSAPLSSTLPEYALISALHDSRFPRVTPRELPRLRASVTLLTDFEDRGGDVDDWVVGEHGIRISFSVGGRRYGATYLPSVAEEQGWDREETMVSLMRKAGWEGGGLRANWREVAERGGMRVERYRGDKEEVAWGEYKAYRDWVDENWEGEE